VPLLLGWKVIVYEGTGMGAHTLLRQRSDLGGPVLRLIVLVFRWTPGWPRAEW
jgi:hypothetical protein